MTVLDGGLPAWKAAGYEVTDVVPEPTPRTFTGTRRPGLIRSTDEIAANLDDAGTILVNVLDEATYRGEVDTYARRGHIPGSINLPVFTLKDPETGRLRPVDELRAGSQSMMPTRTSASPTAVAASRPLELPMRWRSPGATTWRSMTAR